jgi:hypothetical protein
MIVGGAQENTLLSVIGLDALPEYDVTLLSGIDKGREGELLSEAREKTNLLIVPEMGRSINPFSDFVAFWKIYRLIKKGRYHIVHTHSSKAGVLGRVAAWLAGTPLIVHTLHSLVFHEYQPWFINKSWRGIKKMCAPITDFFISVSEIIVQKAVKAGVDKPEKFRTIYSGMELDWFLIPLRRLRFWVKGTPLFLYRENQVVDILKRAGVKKYEWINLDRDYLIVAEV